MSSGGAFTKAPLSPTHHLENGRQNEESSPQRVSACERLCGTAEWLWIKTEEGVPDLQSSTGRPVPCGSRAATDAAAHAAGTLRPSSRPAHLPPPPPPQKKVTQKVRASLDPAGRSQGTEAPGRRVQGNRLPRHGATAWQVPARGTVQGRPSMRSAKSSQGRKREVEGIHRLRET